MVNMDLEHVHEYEDAISVRHYLNTVFSAPRPGPLNLRLDKGYLRGALHFGTSIHNYYRCN